MAYISEMARLKRKHAPGDVINGIVLVRRLSAPYWLLTCVCGKQFSGRPDKVRRLEIQSCGCQKRLLMSVKNTRHGLHSRLFPSGLVSLYSGMRSRCENAKVPGYRDYGARGIKVCDRWRESIANFVADMGPRPPGGTLDRIDPTGDYSPENCRWLDARLQNRNKRRTLRAEDGRSLKDVAEQEGVPYSRLRGYVCRGGMNAAEAVAHIKAHPPRTKRRYLRPPRRRKLSAP